MGDRVYTYENLLSVIEQLRGENGCPWDKVQTHESLIPGMLEESYEVVEAINNKDMSNLKEELGDVMLQVLMHSQIEQEKNNFSIDDVVNELCKKLIYRHPHVFGDLKGIDDEKQVSKVWDNMKSKEKNVTGVTQSVDRIAKAMPALMRAYKMQKKVMKSDLCYSQYDELINKIKSRIENLDNNTKNNKNIDKNFQKDSEIGYLLLDIVSLCTFFDINPEFALTKCVEKFINRLRYIENSLFASQSNFKDLSENEKKLLWKECQKLGELY